MSNNKQEQDFLERHKDGLEVIGFWEENYRSLVNRAIEGMYKDYVTKKWRITDVVFNGDKVLIKWQKHIL